jgi:vacuolar-type H+-ATPase subunit E/Vma4
MESDMPEDNQTPSLENIIPEAVIKIIDQRKVPIVLTVRDWAVVSSTLLTLIDVAGKAAENMGMRAVLEKIEAQMDADAERMAQQISRYFEEMNKAVDGPTN